jgi:hypothetical protein
VILHPQPSCGLCRACRAGKDLHCANAFFPGLADTDAVDLADLRATFQCKAHSAAQELVADGLLRAGHVLDDLLAVTLAQVPDGPELDRLRRCGPTRSRSNSGSPPPRGSASRATGSPVAAC